jgi:acetyltransferase
MDKHYLSPLFLPESIAVFAGPKDSPDPALRWPSPSVPRCGPSASPARWCSRHPHHRHPGRPGPDPGRPGHHRAAPGRSHPSAGSGGRIKCRAALVVGSGITPDWQPTCTAWRAATACTCWAPTAWASSARAGLNASVAGPLAATGPLALVSQSGALTASILDWARQNACRLLHRGLAGPQHRGGHCPGAGLPGQRRSTHSIVVYMEGIRQRAALHERAARRRQRQAGGGAQGRAQAAGNQAAQTHSGTIVGSDDVFDAALRRAGAVRVRSFVELFSAAKCLASRYRPVGKRLAIVTNGGGPGVLAADWASEIGLELGRCTRAGARNRAPAARPGLADRPATCPKKPARRTTAPPSTPPARPAVDGVLVCTRPSRVSTPPTWRVPWPSLDAT